MRGVVFGLLGLALAGCAGGDVMGFGPGVTGGGGGLPAVRAEAAPDLMTPPGRRDLGLAIRTLVVQPDGTQAEVAGATCLVTAGPFSARLTSPARLVIPDLGPDAPDVRADCASGALVGAAMTPPAFLWAQSGGDGLQRASWGLGWTYGGYKVGPVRYPNLTVLLRERAR
jgi:hypothetical protein